MRKRNTNNHNHTLHYDAEYAGFDCYEFLGTGIFMTYLCSAPQDADQILKTQQPKIENTSPPPTNPSTSSAAGTSTAARKR